MYNNNIIRNSVTEGCACGCEIRQEYQIIWTRGFCGGHRISLRITTRALTLKANCDCDRVGKKSQNPRQRSPTRIRFDIFFLFNSLIILIRSKPLIGYRPGALLCTQFLGITPAYHTNYAIRYHKWFVIIDKIIKKTKQTDTLFCFDTHTHTHQRLLS